MRFSLLMLFALIYFTLDAGVRDSIRMEEKRGNLYIIHQVDPEETMYSLARRYGVEVADIRKTNRLRNNEIKVGQFLEIPYGDFEHEGKTHIVKKGETLFSIARMYDVAVEDLRRMNRLRTNSLSIGQQLVVENVKSALVSGANDPSGDTSSDEEADEESTTPQYEYYVQTGETMESVAARFKTNADSILIWNDLQSTKLEIGQKLVFPFELDTDSAVRVTEVPEYEETGYGSKIRTMGEGGITKVLEEGIARKIETKMDTDKYLALHRSLRVGSVLQVKNLMNNQTIYVRVVGKLPETGLNQNVMIRLTSVAFERLGLLDEKGLVEINYFRE